MDWLEFVATALGALVWPVFAAFALLLLYPHLRTILPRITELSAGGFKLALKASENASSIFDDARALGKPTAPHQEIIKVPWVAEALVELSPDELQGAAREPRAIVMRSWGLLRDSMKEALERLCPGEPIPEDLNERLAILDRKVWLPARFYVTLDRLGSAFQEVRKGAEATTVEAESFVRTANTLRRTFEAIERPALQAATRPPIATFQVTSMGGS